MKKSLTVLFLLLIFLIAAIAFLRVKPQATPAQLKPAIAWIEKTQIELSGQFIDWRNRLLGISAQTVASNPGSTAVLSDSARAPELSRVNIGRSEVAKVEINARGDAIVTTEVKTEVKTKFSAEASAIQSSVTDTEARNSTKQPPVESNIALAALTDTDDVISKADAAIAAADAALARARDEPQTELKTEPHQAAELNPVRSEGADLVVTVSGNEPVGDRNSDLALATLQPAASAVGSRTDGGSIAGGAAIVLSQTVRTFPGELDRHSERPVIASLSVGETTNSPALTEHNSSSAGLLLERLPARTDLPLQMSALPASALAAPQVIPPDAPLPPRPVTKAGRKQQATISHFLTGQVVEFETGRDVLTGVGQQALARLLVIIQANQDTIITVQGHTDNVGDESSNLELSSARSIRARAFLVARGVGPDRLRVQGFGERRPIANNRTAEGRIRNRRIDFAVSDR